MTAFDLFQRATCEVHAEQRGAAAMTLTRAIRLIEKAGATSPERYMLADLIDMRRQLIAQVSA